MLCSKASALRPRKRRGNPCLPAPLGQRAGGTSQKEDSERGNALIEFIFLGTTLMLPTLYFLLTVFALQSAAFAASNASQQSLQYLVQAPSGQTGSAAVQEVAVRAAGDFGLEPELVSATLDCEQTCGPGEKVAVSVTVQVQLPLVPWPGAPHIATMTSVARSWGGLYS